MLNFNNDIYQQVDRKDYQICFWNYLILIDVSKIKY